MSIEAKHAYRFGYLKSDEWHAVRLRRLAMDHGKCRLCGEFSISNDAHHIKYPKNWYNTRTWHLVTLCRKCHDRVHDEIEKQPGSWKEIKRRILPKQPGRFYAKLHAKESAETRKKFVIYMAWIIHWIKKMDSIR